MGRLLLEKVGKSGAGRNAILKINAAGLEGGKLRIFDDHIEFKIMWFTKSVSIKDIDFAEIRAKYAFWFAHHGNTWRFLSFYCKPSDREEIIQILKSLKIKIKEEANPRPKLSPY